MNVSGDCLVKSCRRLERGLRLGPEGIRACQLGAFASPIYWSAEEASRLRITKEMIQEKRKWLFELLNDPKSDNACNRCQMVITKPYRDVNFNRLGQIDWAATTICNLRCKFCGIATGNLFAESKYDDLGILKEFQAEDVEWDSVVDFNGGEPTLLRNVHEYLEYFTSRRIRVRFFTNAVKFHPSVYEGLVDGSIQWACTSVDAGTPTTYWKIKKRDHFLQVLENLTRYAQAGSRGGGMLAVKYIFCNDNCGDDDISGFAYAMLAIRPQKIWLTFDFSVLGGLRADSEDFGGYDYSKDIAAYVKMYKLMKKHGLDPVHYTTGHLAAVCRQGKILLDQLMREINGSRAFQEDPDLVLRDFRQREKRVSAKTARLSTNPLRITMPEKKPEPWSLSGKRVLLAPACTISVRLLEDPDIRKSNLLGFLDRDRVIQGKNIAGIPIHGYEEIPNLNPQVVLVASPEQHRTDIVHSLIPYRKDIGQIVVYGSS